MVPNKTIYVREADTELWDKAEKLAGGSVSSLITEALRRYVEEEERRDQSGMETIEIDLWGQHERPYRAKFIGRWLVHPDPDETRTALPGHDPGAYYGVALTRRGNLAVYSQHCNQSFAPVLETFNSFEEAEKAGWPGDVLAMAGAELGYDYVQKLDI